MMNIFLFVRLWYSVAKSYSLPCFENGVGESRFNQLQIMEIDWMWSVKSTLRNILELLNV